MNPLICLAGSATGMSSGNIVHCPSIGSSFPWKKIWQIACSNKVKNFAWRLAHNSLPLKRNIEARGIQLDTRCPVCMRYDEDSGHMFFKCKVSKGVWRELQLEHIRTEHMTLHSPREVFYYIWRCDEDLQVKLITLMWVLGKKCYKCWGKTKNNRPKRYAGPKVPSRIYGILFQEERNSN
jgi:hypothetical protein